MNDTGVTLRTGEQHHEGLVRVTMLSLSELMKSNPIAFYEFVELCRDSEHRLFGNTKEVLEGLHLLEGDGQPHDATREIALAATEGDGLELTLRDPRQPERKERDGCQE